MRFFLACLAAGIVLGCTNEPAPSDGGALDAPGADDAFELRDAAPCDLACPMGRVCCLGATGPHCVDLANDITNCGICNRDCVALRRGDSCAHNQCGCGDFEIGCTGAENSICCTDVVGLRPYCGNPGLDFDNCGGCGHVCDSAQASHCSGGLCLCGDTGGACAGTVADLCCADPAGAFECVDSRTDQAHCGACNRRCSAFERCEGGACVPTLTDAGVTDV
jgi:hypothetical protein